MSGRNITCTVIVLTFLLSACGPRESRLEHFTEAMNAANRATSVINKPTGPGIMSEDDVIEMLSHYKQALAHAEKVDTDFLDSKYPGWGTHFNAEFVEGLRMSLKADETGDMVTSIRGQKLMSAWGEWYSQNLPAIRNTL